MYIHICIYIYVHILYLTVFTCIIPQDPDAASRQGKQLADSDNCDEQTLTKHLFACVRAGQLAEAQELCVQLGEPWRAASIEGWKLYHDPNYGKSNWTTGELLDFKIAVHFKLAILFIYYYFF